MEGRLNPIPTVTGVLGVDPSTPAAKHYAERAEAAAERAEAAADGAAYSAGDAEDSAEQAADSATSALGYAERAEQAATNAGFMFLHMEDGHIIYERTDAVDADFSLEDGHLILEAI